MKHSLLFAVLLGAAALIVGCGLFGTTADWFPMTVGSTWHYRTTTIASFGGMVDTTYAGQFVQVTGIAQTGAGDEVTVFSHTESTFIEVPQETTIVTTHTSYVRETDGAILGYDDLNDTEPDTALALPLEQGKTWTMWSSGDTSVTGTVVAKENVSVYAGTFTDCWKVEMRMMIGGTSQSTYFWYADGVGRVRNLFDINQTGYMMSMHTELHHSDIKK